MDKDGCPKCQGTGYDLCSQWEKHMAEVEFDSDPDCAECRRLQKEARPCLECGCTGKLPDPFVTAPPLTEEQEQPTSQCFGGYLADIPEPHIRKWPGSREPLRVKTRIMTYYGIGTHYFASAEAADNPLWDSREKVWRIPWDDMGQDGLKLRATFDRLDQAKAWLKYIVPRYFDMSKVELDGDLEYAGGVFTYPYEGD